MLTSISRRSMLATLLAGTAGFSSSGWFPLLANQLVANPARRRHVVLLWMSGGPAQTDTFDLKPNHENGGEFSEIQTNVPGLRFSEHLPRLATMGDQLAVIRGVSTKEGDHGRGTYLMRTGHKPMGPVQHPCIGASLSRQLNSQDASGLPGYVSAGPYRALNQDAFKPGFLGPRFGPLVVGASDIPDSVRNGSDGYPILKVKDLAPPSGVTKNKLVQRLDLSQKLQTEFLNLHKSGAPKMHRTVYDNAVQLMNSQDAAAFDLSEEKSEVRERYGDSVFGQGCLLARRLIERGVPFIEVSLGTNSGGVGWDTHVDGFTRIAQLSAELDAGWASLMQDLKERDLLESTTILWMGEFGRTPRINNTSGRDHYPNAWSCILAGGGIDGGQAYGATSEDGTDVIDGKVGAEDVLATLIAATGISPHTTHDTNLGRPIALADGTPIKAILS